MKNRLLGGLALAGALAFTAPLAASAQEGAAPLRAASADARQGDNGIRGEARPDHPHRMHRHQRMTHAHGMHSGMQGLRGLDLSEAQRDRIFELRHAQAPELREQGKALRAASRELHALSLSADYDAGKAREIGERMAQARTRIALLHAQTGNEVWKTLTPEQREKLANRAPRRDKGVPGGDRPAG